jgi:hypothetical protein
MEKLTQEELKTIVDDVDTYFSNIIKRMNFLKENANRVLMGESKLEDLDEQTKNTLNPILNMLISKRKRSIEVKDLMKNIVEYRQALRKAFDEIAEFKQGLKQEAMIKSKDDELRKI